MTYFRENIEKMAGYVPGEQPKPGEKVIKLNTNENPYPPSPAALEVLRGADAEALRRYPDPLATRFRQVVSETLEVPLEAVIAGNGSMPTDVLYRTLAEIQDARAVEVPYDEEYSLPADELAAAAAAVTFVASPNSPSGTAYSLRQLDALAESVPGVLVVDEAYVDFADGHCLDLAGRR